MTVSTAQSPSAQQQQQQQQSETKIYLSPTLIVMLVVIATAFVLISYSRLISRYLSMWRQRFLLHRRQNFPPASPTSYNENSPLPSFFNSPFITSHGLQDSVINTIPLSLYNNKATHDHNSSCAVCLLEFQHGDYIRTLPICSHSFHVDCIDAWLNSHVNCPLCRSLILRPDQSPFGARIRQEDVNDTVLHGVVAESSSVTEIVPCIEEQTPRRHSCNNIYSDDYVRDGNNHCLLKRSYSFGYEERNERMVVMTEPMTASPWRWRRAGFWNKRSLSPFGALTRSRMTLFKNYNRGVKSSPLFFRRRGAAMRRSKWVASPLFMATSRVRCGDPEALLSPERLNRR